MKYYTYFRCSTKGQMNGVGLKHQEDTVNKFCEDNGYCVCESFYDQSPESINHRTNLVRLLGLLDNGDKIIVCNTKVLWRHKDTKDCIINVVKLCGADVISVEDPNYSIYNEPSRADHILDFLFE